MWEKPPEYVRRYDHPHPHMRPPVPHARLPARPLTHAHNMGSRALRAKRESNEKVIDVSDDLADAYALCTRLGLTLTVQGDASINDKIFKNKIHGWLGVLCLCVYFHHPTPRFCLP